MALVTITRARVCWTWAPRVRSRSARIFLYRENSAGDMKAVVNALAEKSLVNVISTPSVLVLDNHTAAIHVGDQQPIQSMVSVTDGGVSQTSINYKDTGVKLEVTPSVNDGGLVTLDVMQSVMAASGNQLEWKEGSLYPVLSKLEKNA